MTNWCIELFFVRLLSQDESRSVNGSQNTPPSKGNTKIPMILTSFMDWVGRSVFWFTRHAMARKKGGCSTLQVSLGLILALVGFVIYLNFHTSVSHPPTHQPLIDTHLTRQATRRQSPGDNQERHSSNEATQILHRTRPTPQPSSPPKSRQFSESNSHHLSPHEERPQHEGLQPPDQSSKTPVQFDTHHPAVDVPAPSDLEKDSHHSPPSSSSSDILDVQSIRQRAAKRSPATAQQRPTLSSTPPVIVGGTDGSGTRGAVTFLLSSGVLMLSDAGSDGGCQYDVHGKELHSAGWPPVVQNVLTHTHSPDFVPKRDLPENVETTTREAVRRMAAAFRRRVNGKLKREGNPEFYTRWGFKAPVSMYMLPYWAEEFPNCTFVHVVRDGRDMVFHWLQSPVKRYWRHLFPAEFAKLPSNQRHPDSLIPTRGNYIGKAYIYSDPKFNMAPHLRIAELWAKSNMLVEKAGLRLAMNAEENFNFVTVRSEDFVTNEDRFLTAAADLLSAVHPSMDLKELCCLIRHHWKMEQSSPGWAKSTQNYGKWKKAIEAYGGTGTGNPGSFYSQILQRSSTALGHFGYLDSTWQGASVGLECDASASCPTRPVHKQKCLD